ncbi:type II toxin-antitoxin system RelE/ParE family toxin [Hoeflea sp. AS16]|uniref:type II toxin-antitoxin system RelE/ParE family toxin n=1 Tax=Hoeflea sp. AS16 TaxID=3135779 RepID=UPI003179BD32
MARYRLTKAADQDFERIFEFGIDQFGLAQALDYQNGMKQRFDKLAVQPNLYQAIDHIRQGYRRSVYQAHSIYYRIDDELILIVRILGRENPETSLPEQDGT